MDEEEYPSALDDAEPTQGRSKRLASFLAALALACALIALWNSQRLAARAEMLTEQERAWALGALDLIAPEGLREGIGSFQNNARAQISSWRSHPPSEPQPASPASPATAEAIASSDEPEIQERSQAKSAAAPELPLDGSATAMPDLAALANNAAKAPLPKIIDADLPAQAPALPASIHFAGDSLANGYAAGGSAILLQAKSKSQSIDHGRISTGLAAKSYYDWDAKTREICAQSPGAIVFSFGANDPMDMREAGVFLKFGSPEWAAAYSERALSMVNIARGCGAKSVWIMMPPMRDAAFERKAATLRNAQAKACKASDACIKPFSELGALEQVFQERWTVYGKAKLLRAQDGIHLAPEGYRLVARQALEPLGLTKDSKGSKNSKNQLAD